MIAKLEDVTRVRLIEFNSKGNFICRKHILRSEALDVIQRHEKDAMQLLRKSGAAHVLYGIKVYNRRGELVSVQLMNEAMDDKEFYTLTRRMRGALIYALHKRDCC